MKEKNEETEVDHNIYNATTGKSGKEALKWSERFYEKHKSDDKYWEGLLLPRTKDDHLN